MDRNVKYVTEIFEMASANPYQTMTLDRTSPVPLYHQLKEILLAQIKEEHFKPGQAILPEWELCERYGVSRVTIRRAISELEQAGYVDRQQGKGTFVIHPRIRREIGRVTSFSEEMRAQGRRPGSRLLNLQHKPADESIAFLLDLEEGDAVWIVERLRLADDEVVSFSISYLWLPPDVSLTPIELEEQVSLWSLLEKKGIYLTEGDVTVEAMAADAHYVKLLDVEEGAPLLIREGVNYSKEGVPVERFKVISRADRYKYFVHVAR